MAHTHSATTNGKDPAVKNIWKVFWILLVITSVEVGLAFLHLETGIPSKLWLNSIFILLTLLKAFYIVAEFMHLRHEVKNLIMTILFPLLLFVWFIIAFLMDGDSWKKMRVNLAPGTPAVKEAPAHQPAHH